MREVTVGRFSSIKHHSTESALMKVLSDILDAADCRQVTLLGLFDLSAAFDTVSK